MKKTTIVRGAYLRCTIIKVGIKFMDYSSELIDCHQADTIRRKENACTNDRRYSCHKSVFGKKIVFACGRRAALVLGFLLDVSHDIQKLMTRLNFVLRVLVIEPSSYLCVDRD